MRAPHCLVVQLENEVIRRIVHHADLLEHDSPFEVQIGLAEGGPEDEIGDDVGRDGKVFVEHSRVVRGVLASRIGVESAAERLQRERDLTR